MKRILFVDDDVSVLEGLRLRLRPMQDKWAMTFVCNGAQALCELQQGYYDVLVSDIRMPGMHGARLLRAVGERWPQTVRIALSGFASEELLHVVPIAHRFLSKPCEELQLEHAIERCLGMQDLLPEQSLRALAGRVQRLPPVRATYQKLRALLATKRVTVREVAALIASDTVMTAKLLQTINSSLFDLKGTTTDVDAAVGSLGLDRLRQLVMSAEVFAQWPSKAAAAVIDLERLQLHVDAVVNVGRALTLCMPIAGETLVAARLHEIGYWILAQECPQQLERAVRLASAGGLSVDEAEREVIGASHAEVGAYLLGLWGLPAGVVGAVAEHHVPEPARRLTFDTSAALAVAIALAGSLDVDAIRTVCPRSATVGPDYFKSVQAPFGWEEAVRRARHLPGQADGAS